MWGPVLLSLSILVSADGGLAPPDTGPPTGSPQCFSSLSPNSSSELLLLCSWPGGQPEPTLLWQEDNTKPAGSRQQLNVSRRTDSLVVTMNSTDLYDGQTFKCVGWHPELQDTTEKACTVTLRAPYPVGYPLVTGFAKHNVTLSCSDEVSNPPAKITWMRKEEIRDSSKYVISQVGPVSSLTIVNCSKDTDEGIYFCKTENPLLREMEVYLTIKKMRTTMKCWYWWTQTTKTPLMTTRNQKGKHPLQVAASTCRRQSRKQMKKTQQTPKEAPLKYYLESKLKLSKKKKKTSIISNVSCIKICQTK
uniref:Ig-like domain-containing protein n=1 Tax=Erpetoichthys calabaricus TaxID=27687 RepID=A0A8C4TBB1_ERPCA